MAKITQLSSDATPSTSDLVLTVKDPGGTPGSRKVAISDLLALGGGGSSGLKAIKVVPVNSGTITITTGSWQAFGPDITIPADIGDVLEVSPAFLANSGNDTEIDLVTIVSGSPLNYLSSGNATQLTHGFGGWYSHGDLLPFGPSVSIVVVSGDIETGNVTVRIVAKCAGATRSWFAGPTDYPGMITVKNLGPVTP